MCTSQHSLFRVEDHTTARLASLDLAPYAVANASHSDQCLIRCSTHFRRLLYLRCPGCTPMRDDRSFCPRVMQTGFGTPMRTRQLAGAPLDHGAVPAGRMAVLDVAWQLSACTRVAQSPLVRPSDSRVKVGGGILPNHGILAHVRPSRSIAVALGVRRRVVPLRAVGPLGTPRIRSRLLKAIEDSYLGWLKTVVPMGAAVTTLTRTTDALRAAQLHGLSS